MLLLKRAATDGDTDCVASFIIFVPKPSIPVDFGRFLFICINYYLKNRSALAVNC